MHLINRLLHWTTLPAGRRVMAVLGAALVIVLACNPDLLPLLPVVDALGLDVLVLVLLLGAQLVAALPGVRERASRGTKALARLLIGALAGAAGGYLRQLAWWLARGPVIAGRK
ncbi:hypothetical protein ABFC53_17995 [Stenotrophomonas pavanii]|uniref:Membrane protein n=1 Tax=Stenotrophomonas maltophilia TaxID=40324 RepID=A0AB34TQG4_STEMA|nr:MULTISPECIES: hypothetical protein [Stenotrophomonas]TGR52153.1 hypothetical protein EN842_15580 [bacterium M00.F.Ca.ET.199.01.1.1]TGT05794.1 hypothetical protein EN820_14125 [bacterium M00.F.Ca.ET.177.01.1.1]TGT62829.1 hypothetical protein EN813_014265 [Mesorhizobium sp. M00.F.Ca.ET.170.01.1.1]TGU14067.1 hypothetical protein EN806_08820 [bacterium M00.F.Ca.ET.163.01.1.1]TGU95970.1 hypothetical protein EN794_017095 [Mesorhizobium sp. M00.F.Ca.ET.151.01.1.1]TGV58859.1 hypothetical protein E